MRTEILTCYELLETHSYNCCDSCHEDWEEEGMLMCCGKTEDGREYHVCCVGLKRVKGEVE